MGNIKQKFLMKYMKNNKSKNNGKLILVTAISPTPLGEGKTTVSIAIADGLRKIGKKSILSIKRAFFRASFWNKRRSNWRRKSTNCSNGRYKFTFYRRYSCNNIS